MGLLQAAQCSTKTFVALSCPFRAQATCVPPYRKDRVEINAMTFASPRVGNEAFSAVYHHELPNSWRLFNDQDLVPMVPFWFGYHHVPNGVMVLSKDSKQEVPGKTKPLLALLDSQSIDVSGLVPEGGNAVEDEVWRNVCKRSALCTSLL